MIFHEHFIWDAQKYDSNIKKHGIDFFEAATVLMTHMPSPHLMRRIHKTKIALLS